MFHDPRHGVVQGLTRAVVFWTKVVLLPLLTALVLAPMALLILPLVLIALPFLLAACFTGAADNHLHRQRRMWRRAGAMA